MNQDSKQNNKPLHPTAARQRQQLAEEKLLAEIETLNTEADQLPDGDRRTQIVDRIAKLSVEYQAED